MAPKPSSPPARRPDGAGDRSAGQGEQRRQIDRARQTRGQNGADAIISLPPEKAGDQAMIEYYKSIGQATELPLFVQTEGDMSVDLIVEMANQIPPCGASRTRLATPGRVAQIRERTHDKLAVFSGNGVRTMIDEMRLGFLGHCPTVELSDFFAAAFDLWHAGQRGRRSTCSAGYRPSAASPAPTTISWWCAACSRKRRKHAGARSPVRRRGGGGGRRPAGRSTKPPNRPSARPGTNT